MLEAPAIALGLLLASWRSFVVALAGLLYPSSEAWADILLWVLVAVAIVWMLVRHSLFEIYCYRWGQNWPVILFILLAAASLLWSIDFFVSLYYVTLLFVSSILGAYLGSRYPLDELLGVLAAYFVFLVVACYTLVIVWPDAGRMNFDPYGGSWRGIFWHRNYLGGAMALGNLIFLVRLVTGRKSQGKGLIFNGLFYIATFALVLLSRSATGLFLLVILHALLGLIWAWLRWKQRLKRIHFWMIGVSMLLVILLTMLNLDPILGLVGRDPTFTGRVPLWNYLLTNIVSQHPWLGYGFGAIWAQGPFRVHLRDILGWPNQIGSGHNGYMDILLYLGWIGLAIFLVVIGCACVRFLRFASREQTILGFTPLLILVYTVIINITQSYLLQTEAFVWMTMIAFLFVATSGMATQKK